MDSATQQHYLQMATNHPNMLCSEAPIEMLEAATFGDEPTEFLKEFFATGYIQWLSQKHGRKIQLGKERTNNAIVVLWLRAGRLYVSHLLGRPDAEWDKPFFSDDGLYG